MLRKIFKVFLVIVFIGFISAYVRGVHYNSNKLKSDKSVVQENIETKKQNIIDEELISSIINDNESKEEVKENNTSNNKVINNKNEEIKNTIPEQKQESNQNEEKQINNISNKNETKTNDVIEQVPEVDDEYNNLVNFIDYKADEFNKCHTDSIDVALSDTDNIRNTSCKQFAYNGKLVGYKIQIFYNDGTYKYYK
jgi:hypothetical protein